MTGGFVGENIFSRGGTFSFGFGPNADIDFSFYSTFVVFVKMVRSIAAVYTSLLWAFSAGSGIFCFMGALYRGFCSNALISCF